MRRTTVDDLLAEARSGLARLEPAGAFDAGRAGAVLVDLRSADQRYRHGVVPGSVHIPLSVLLWRCDPDSGHRNPAVPGLDGQLVLFCADGCSSSLAAASLQRLGFARATDLVGGFTAWKAAGLPVRAARQEHGSEPLGMDPPEPS